MIPWIEELHERGYKVYYLSNYPEKIARECAHEMRFLHVMDGGILSYKIGMVKPNGEIYKRLLSDYGLKAEECLFVDDREDNCAAAIKEGFAALQYTTYKDVRAKMEALLHGQNE